ncbi:MAG: chorismate synthase [Candidatus Methanofastidiosum methylothiophilum]|uniref:Chorismate synthase n=1 Tax=Candidatus Methanofastidiosum methylothiophilum TaxID=1705564 RepID=A0A150IX11_9EURY|nr:MAG: chorismate synthase [Candidatus Methanofastidiosum methylthiophilus]KYC46777.1 MAG: chorismate synthase [Candidatus Methanofastidiosum methylthiophilus]KYC49204.1 MAG: chorismate synthase [Candidatus Methanofastidiosum methylthiophilus]
MGGNTYGRLFRMTTWGESHGKSLGVIIDGCPPGIKICEDDINKEMTLRKPKSDELSTSRREEDRCEILSGVFEGKTLGTPISLIIENKDVDSSSYEKIKGIFRPGHADYTYFKKYGFYDYRGGGRASGRETVGRVAAGAVARTVLKSEIKNFDLFSYTKAIGNIRIPEIDHKSLKREEIIKDSLWCPDKKSSDEMVQQILEARSKGESVGGIVEIVAKNVPSGLGEPVFDKLEADIGKGLLSIGAVKGVEFGRGFELSALYGSESNDQMTPRGFLTNRSGGIIGGISSGEDIIVRVAVKPIPSISKKQKTTDINGKERFIEIGGRHDPCAIPRINPVCEAMVAVTLLDHLLMQKAIGGVK